MDVVCALHCTSLHLADLVSGLVKWNCALARSPNPPNETMRCKIIAKEIDLFANARERQSNRWKRERESERAATSGKRQMLALVSA